MVHQKWVLRADAVITLGRFRRYSLIPQLLAVIIGLHFLARPLRAPRYYIVGMAMILCVLAWVLVPEGSIRNSLRAQELVS